MERGMRRNKRRLIAVMVVLLGLAWILVPAARAATPGRSGQAQAAAPESFYFVQVTDSHWGARDGVSLTRKAVEMINTLPVKIEFVAVTGDIFSDSIRKDDVVSEGLAAMKALKSPVYYVPGNHDLLKNDQDATVARFEKSFGPLNKAVQVGGVLCLFVCTEIAEGQERNPADDERDWIGKSLKRKPMPTLVFMHRPPLHDVVNGSDGAVSWQDEYDSRWKLFFDSHPEIKAVFAGHLHRDVMGWIGDVPVYVAPALARFWDRQPSFRLYRYLNGRVNYWTLYPDRPAANRKVSKPSS